MNDRKAGFPRLRRDKPSAALALDLASGGDFQTPLLTRFQHDQPSRICEDHIKYGRLATFLLAALIAIGAEVVRLEDI